MRLLNIQKNELFKIIENNNHFQPNQFQIEENELKGNWKTKISFDNNYYFKIFEDSEYYNSCYANYSPGDNKFLEVTNNISFETIKIHFAKWLLFLHQEISESNLWEAFNSQIIKFKESAIADNSKFSAREYLELQDKMSILFENISHIPMLIEQRNEIRNELKRITDLAIDLGKFDWTNLFVGTIISIIIQLKVTPENANLLFQYIKNLFSNFLFYYIIGYTNPHFRQDFYSILKSNKSLGDTFRPLAKSINVVNAKFLFPFSISLTVPLVILELFRTTSSWVSPDLSLKSLTCSPNFFSISSCKMSI